MAEKNTGERIPKELKILKYWTGLLGISDWYIILETNVKPEDMFIDEADGCVKYEETIKSAQIQIVDEKLRSPTVRPFDFEETLVHELLHIKFCMLERGKNWDKKLQLRLLHQAIDDISRALVSAKKYKEKR